MKPDWGHILRDAADAAPQDEEIEERGPAENSAPPSSSWPGLSRLVPAIHVFLSSKGETWMPGVKAGHDERAGNLAALLTTY
jgi:hypothetical protein